MSPLVVLILWPDIVDTGCPKVPPAESMPATIHNFFWLYGFEQSCNKRPKKMICEYDYILISFLTMEPAFLVPPEEFFEFPQSHAKDGAHGFWKLRRRWTLQSASAYE